VFDYEGDATMGNAKYIGRVGALAVALGIGTAVATTPGVALAEPSAESSSASDSSSDASSATDSTSADDSKPAPSVDSSGADDAADASDEDDASVTSGVAADEGSAASTDGDGSAPSDTPEATDEELADAESGNDAQTPVSEPVAVAEPSDSDGPAASQPVTVDPPEPVATSATVSRADGPEPVGSTASGHTPIALALPAATASWTGQTNIPEPQAVSTAASPAPAPVSGVVSNLLAWVGLGPSATGTGPVAPPISPALVLASAVVRRELQQTVEAEAPTVSLVPTSQTVPDLLGGLLGGVLHLLFNNTPTLSHNPADNVQHPQAVITGAVTGADIDGDALVYTVTRAPEHGSVVLNADGSFTYTPDAAFANIGGTDTFEVTVSDNTYFHLAYLGGAHTATESVEVHVERINAVIDTIAVGDGPTDVIVSPDGTAIYTANAFGDSVSVIDTVTGTVTHIPVGDAPNGLAMGANFNGPFIAVTNFNDDNFTGIDPATNTVIATSPDIGDGPVGIASSPDGFTGYIANNLDDTVSVLDINGVTVIPVGDGPSYVALSPNGDTAYVSNAFGDSVSVIDTASRTVTATITVGDGPRDVAVSPSGATVYVTNSTGDTVSVIDTATNTVTATITVGDGPGGVAVSPDGARAYVVNQFDGNVSVIDTATNTVVDTVTVGSDPAFVTVSPDGNFAYVTNFGDDTVSVIRL
jgi:YVTN family beta-propeller protein